MNNQGDSNMGEDNLSRVYASRGSAAPNFERKAKQDGRTIQCPLKDPTATKVVGRNIEGDSITSRVPHC